MTASCPDWRALTAHRNDPRAPEPEGWDDALAHFDACSRCRPAALAADPSLLFRRLRESPPTASSGDEDVLAIRQGVAALRAGRRLDDDRRRGRSPWGRWAAAAALAVAALSAGANGRDDRVLPIVEGTAAEIQSAQGEMMMPVVEEIGPDARLIQVQQGDFPVAMVYDEGLEI
jgi:hypothetical protein